MAEPLPGDYSFIESDASIDGRPSRLLLGPRSVAAGVVGVALLALTGCGGGGSNEPEIAGAAARKLAAESTLIARSLDAGHGCAAERQAKTLLAGVRSAAASGAIPPPLRGAALRAALRIAAAVPCTPPAPAPPPQQAQAAEDAQGDEAPPERVDSSDEKHGHKHKPKHPHEKRGHGHGREDSG